MIRNALIALYIMLVLAISAVSRAESHVSPIVFEPKRQVGPVIIPPRSVDPLPGTGGMGHNSMIKLVFGNIEIRN
jgi:hypothetical protein